MKTRYTLLSTILCLILVAGYRDQSGAAQEAPKKIDVTAKRFEYQPSEITLKKGQPVVIVFKSMDVAHGIHFKELNLQAKIPKGGTAQLAFTPMQTGDFVGHCSTFCGSGHGGMAMTLHVVE